MCKNTRIKIIGLLYAVLLTAIVACGTDTTDDELFAPNIYFDCTLDDLSVANEENDTSTDSTLDNADTPVDTLNNEDTTDEDTTDVYTPYEKDQLPYNEEPCACSDLCEIMREQLQVWTVEELGEIIVAAMLFWEDWWHTRNMFDWEHMDYRRSVPKNHWDCYSNYVVLLSTSGFENLNDIHDYLLQLYTATWVDTLLARAFPPFVEYNNMLYINVIRHCSVYLTWETATHTIINQSGCHTLVESTAVSWWIEPYCETNGTIKSYYESKVYFTFVNGRINSSSHCPIFRGPLRYT